MNKNISDNRFLRQKIVLCLVFKMKLSYYQDVARICPIICITLNRIVFMLYAFDIQ